MNKKYSRDTRESHQYLLDEYSEVLNLFLVKFLNLIDL
jgi:hypothetical protein